ncbi:MAG: prephenate dehydratase [Succinivibrionaceae bacterium]|nr:prephenate dehydratase [Succinivibrionaceae bacterium]
MANLKEARESIDRIDSEILDLLGQRLRVACDIACAKSAEGRPVVDHAREGEKLRALGQMAQDRGISPAFVREVYRAIMALTADYEQSFLIASANPRPRQVSVAFLGAVGSYSHLAAHRFAGEVGAPLEEIPCRSFPEIVQAVEGGKALYGVLPIENSSSGSVNEALDALSASSVSLVDELYCPIDHAILATEGAGLQGITDLYSHPQPFAQCSRWLKERLPGVAIHYTKSTADAMSEVAAMGKGSCAAIGSARSAGFYRLMPLAMDIANNLSNYTRFVVLSPTPILVPAGIGAKTSIIFSVEKYRPGSLIRVLEEFSSRGINLTKLSSRPRLKEDDDAWEEIFFADLEANLDDAQMQEAMARLREETLSLRILGCYQSADSRRPS